MGMISDPSQTQDTPNEYRRESTWFFGTLVDTLVKRLRNDRLGIGG